MPDDADGSPGFLSSLPTQPISDEIVKQIGESDNPKIRGAMSLDPAPTSIKTFLLNMKTQTYVLVFDPTQEQWRVYESFNNSDMNHQDMIDHASEIANEWFAESLSDRIAADEEH